MKPWNGCKNILCIRADNMGDIIMSEPAFRALKKSFGCRITLLTSPLGSPITPHISSIDETVIAPIPWIKTKDEADEKEVFDLIKKIKEKHFDAAIIFTVYSQNPLPAAMICYLAGIPRTLAYCRENPYHLLSDWILDKEPLTFIQHQVRRDLNLVQHIGAFVDDEHIYLKCFEKDERSLEKRMKIFDCNDFSNVIIFHPGVSETKRQFPESSWIEIGQKLQSQGNKIVITGGAGEKNLCTRIANETKGSVCLAGDISLGEFIVLIKRASLVISVNTVTAHIAAAFNTPSVIFYACTNPQHTPWQKNATVIYFPVKEELKSKNQLIQFVDQHWLNEIPMPSVKNILNQINQRIVQIGENHAPYYGTDFSSYSLKIVMDNNQEQKKPQTFTSENLRQEISEKKPNPNKPTSDSNLTDEELETLKNSVTDVPGDDENVRRATLDKTDDDGTLLNEEL